MNFTNVSLEHREFTRTTFFQLFFVILLRAGLIAVQLSSVPTQNIYKGILYNILDIGISLACFGSIGFTLSFGDDNLGIIGYRPWFSFEGIDISNVLRGFSACLIANGIITTCLAARVHFVGFIILNILFSAILQPILIHWVWNKNGWMQTQQLLGAKVALIDNFGCLAIHIYAGTIALVGGLFLGRRLILLEEISEMSIGVESPGNSVTGYVFVIIGLMAFIPPGLEAELITIKNLIALGSGILTVGMLQFLICKQTVTYWNMLKCMQGAIASIVTIAGGVHLYPSLTVLLMALCGSGCYYVVQIALQNQSLIEDHCNIVATHLVSGILSLALGPMLTAQNYKLAQSLWHIICILIVLALLAIVAVIFFFLLVISGLLRCESEEINHARSLVVANKFKNRKSLRGLFHVDLNAPQIEPGSRKGFGFNTSVSTNV